MVIGIVYDRVRWDEKALFQAGKESNIPLKLIDAKGFQGRYVRCYSKGNTNNDLNHYIEVEVYGKPSN